MKGVADLVGWDGTTVAIDGRSYPAYERRIPGAWAFVVDLPDLVIGASGPSALAPPTWELTDVTDRLTDYAAGDGPSGE